MTPSPSGKRRPPGPTAAAPTASSRSLLPERLRRQHLVGPGLATPVDVVTWFGAMQAQDQLGALWAVGLRSDAPSEATVEAALAAGSILRTHIFRWTWQYVGATDLRWMLGLVGQRLIRAAAGRHRQLGLDAKTLARASAVFTRALEGGRHLTRTELAAALTRAKIASGGGRLSHLLGHAELAGLLCSGVRQGRQQTFALLDERVPPARTMDRDAALAELARRYYRSRGPASERDFAWWTGLPLSEVRHATRLVQGDLEARQLNGVTYFTAPSGGRRRPGAEQHLLPPFDEYLIAYRDRSAHVDPRHARWVNGGGLLSPVVVFGGEVRGVWRRTLGRDTVQIAVTPFHGLSGSEKTAVERAAERYAGFLGLRPILRFGKRAS